MDSCKGCAALRIRIAELEQSNRNLRHIGEGEDETDALHSISVSPSFIGPTLLWSSSDSVPDVEPVFRVKSILEEILEAESLVYPFPDYAKIASSTPLAGFSVRAGSGSVSARRRDLVREAFAIASARGTAPKLPPPMSAAPTPVSVASPSLFSPSTVPTCLATRAPTHPASPPTPTHPAPPPAPTLPATPPAPSTVPSTVPPCPATPLSPTPPAFSVPAPAGAAPWIMSKRGPNSRLPPFLPPPPFPTQNHFKVLEDDDKHPHLSLSFPPGGKGLRRHTKPQSGTSGNPFQPSAKGRSGPGFCPAELTRQSLPGPLRSAPVTSRIGPLDPADPSVMAAPCGTTPSLTGPLPAPPSPPAAASAGSVSSTARAEAGSAMGAAARAGLSVGVGGSPPAVGLASSGLAEPLGSAGPAVGSTSLGSAAPAVPLAGGSGLGSTQVAGSKAPALTVAPGTKMLILGSSHVRHVRVPDALTHSISGATVKRIHSFLFGSPSLLLRLIQANPLLTSVAIHVGANDIKFKETESLRQDFRSLIRSIVDSGLSLVISGPFISPRYTDEQYSRIRDLHVWLKGHCCSLSIPYVDNYALFFGRREAFVWDGSLGGDRLHLNRMGARLLSQAIELTAKSAQWASFWASREKVRVPKPL